jgi:hypothetical protein
VKNLSPLTFGRGLIESSSMTSESGMGLINCIWIKCVIIYSTFWQCKKIFSYLSCSGKFLNFFGASGMYIYFFRISSGIFGISKFCAILLDLIYSDCRWLLWKSEYFIYFLGSACGLKNGIFIYICYRKFNIFEKFPDTENCCNCNNQASRE